MYYDWIFVITRMHALVQSHDHTCVIKLIINDVWRFSILLPCRDSYAQELPFELFRLLHSTVGLLYLLMEQNKSVRYMVKGFSNVSHSMKFHIGVFIHELSIHLAPHCRNNCCCIDIIGVSILPIYSDVKPSRLLPLWIFQTTVVCIKLGFSYQDINVNQFWNLFRYSYILNL